MPIGAISKSTRLIFEQGKRLLLPSSLPSCSRSSMASCNPVTELSARQILNDVDNFVFDCDGVLWDGLTAIDGSSETLKRLKNLGKKVYYITNNSTNTRKKYKEKCEKLMGIPVTEDEVLCTAYAAALYLHNKKHKGKVYVVGNRAMGEELDQVGINHTGIGPDVVGDKSMLTDFAKTELDPEVNCVLVGFDPDLSLNKMVKGASYARQEGSLFLATNEDSHLPLRSNVTIPGTGSIVAAVKVPARREPIVIGKPNPTIFNVLKEAHGLDPSRTMMVGDRCNTDIALAKNCGLHSLLVLSGVMKQEDVDRDKISADPEITRNLPDHVANCLGDFGKHIPESSLPRESFCMLRSYHNKSSAVRTDDILESMACTKMDVKVAEEIMESTDNFVFDCFGVLWKGEAAVPGSVETIALLKSRGKKVFYLTNNSNDTRQYYVNTCHRYGFNANEDEVLCTAYLHSRKFTDKVYVIGNPGMAEELDRFGIRHTGLGPDIVGDQRRLEDFIPTELDPEIGCVLVGFDPNISFTKMVKGASYARRPDVLFLATNEDTHLPLDTEDVVVPGTGCIVASIKVPARRDPIVIGKPEAAIFNVLKEAHNLDPARTMMVGDTPSTDILLAKNSGLKSLLVLSGITTQTDMEALVTSSDPVTRRLIPDFYAENLGALGQCIQQLGEEN
ncbi:uncharacterized protein LOC132548408 [Ylistrum balloti]|uniref:uncharacterized protein LOC132548408 n=1 Tax=Ylistrum balloti TaxID=509963 RepID=UPI002905AFA1|nr:uncharacterized protein LOC132548408 [Ylistrum balloti]